MRWTLIATACALVTAWSVPRAGAAQGEGGLDPRLLQGQILSSNHAHPGSKMRRGRAVVLLDAPADKVVALLENYGGYTRFMPNFERSQVLSQRGSSALVYVQISILHGASTVWAQLKLKATKDDGPMHVIEGKMTKGNVELLETRWEVTPYSDTQTLVAFELLLDPDLPLPASAVNNEVQKTARKALKSVRKALAPKAATKS
jgi:ribosome-associated toxin RatA of RatAB toxin-antitoxin module